MRGHSEAAFAGGQVKVACGLAHQLADRMFGQITLPTDIVQLRPRLRQLALGARQIKFRRYLALIAVAGQCIGALCFRR